jgi:large subunit ribosomal protein L7e
MSFDPSKAPLISETLLKARRSLDELAYRKSVNPHQQNKRPRIIRGEDVKMKRPEQFMREKLIKQGSQNKMKRRQREVEMRTRGVKVPKGSIRATVGFAIRIHEGRHASDEIKAALRKLGLKAKYDGIFFKLDEPGIASLLPLAAYVAFGYVTKKSVEELVHRRAFCIDKGGARVALTDNVSVEKKLGDKGILCLNDLSHEIFSIGEHYEAAVGLLAPFKLSAPVGSYEKKLLDVNDEVEDKGGFLGDGMDQFLSKIL